MNLGIHNSEEILSILPFEIITVLVNRKSILNNFYEQKILIFSHCHPLPFKFLRRRVIINIHNFVTNK